MCSQSNSHFGSVTIKQQHGHVAHECLYVECHYEASWESGLPELSNDVNMGFCQLLHTVSKIMKFLLVYCILQQAYSAFFMLLSLFSSEGMTHTFIFS